MLCDHPDALLAYANSSQKRKRKDKEAPPVDEVSYYLLSMPDEILVAIILKLRPIELESILRVCKRLCALVKSTLGVYAEKNGLDYSLFNNLVSLQSLLCTTIPVATFQRDGTDLFCCFGEGKFIVASKCVKIANIPCFQLSIDIITWQGNCLFSVSLCSNRNNMFSVLRGREFHLFEDRGLLVISVEREQGFSLSVEYDLLVIPWRSPQYSRLLRHPDWDLSVEVTKVEDCLVVNFPSFESTLQLGASRQLQVFERFLLVPGLVYDLATNRQVQPPDSFPLGRDIISSDAGFVSQMVTAQKRVKVRTWSPHSPDKVITYDKKMKFTDFPVFDHSHFLRIHPTSLELLPGWRPVFHPYNLALNLSYFASHIDFIFRRMPSCSRLSLHSIQFLDFSNSCWIDGSFLRTLSAASFFEKFSIPRSYLGATDSHFQRNYTYFCSSTSSPERLTFLAGYRQGGSGEEFSMCNIWPSLGKKISVKLRKPSTLDVSTLQVAVYGETSFALMDKSQVVVYALP